MRRFKWIEWNLAKIESHALSAEEVEASFDRVFSLTERADGSFAMFAAAPSGRRIWVIWRFDGRTKGIPMCLTIWTRRRFSSSLLIEMDEPMPDHVKDERSLERRARDEQIAAAPQLAPLDLPPNESSAPMEAYLAPKHRRPLAVAGIVENGLVRPLDPSVKLAELSRVIIVASEDT